MTSITTLSTVELEVDVEPIASTPAEFFFMVVGVKNSETGLQMNEKFFEGRLPVIGEGVEMVYLGLDGNGDMKFNLRVRSK